MRKIKKTLIASIAIHALGLCLVPHTSFASSKISQFEMSQTVADKADSSALAEQCKELALKIDWLGRYQDHPACTNALDGTTAYFASYYIAQKNTRDAKPLLEQAMIKLNYAIDIKCYGRDDMQQVLDALKGIWEQL